jgi:hypothetical protein
VSKHNIAMPIANNPYVVDTAGIGRRILLLPREISKPTCRHIEKSADSIVVAATSRANENDKHRRSHKAMKGGTLNSGYAYWINIKLKPLANAAREQKTYANY